MKNDPAAHSRASYQTFGGYAVFFSAGQIVPTRTQSQGVAPSAPRRVETAAACAAFGAQEGLSFVKISGSRRFNRTMNPWVNRSAEVFDSTVLPLGQMCRMTLAFHLLALNSKQLVAAAIGFLQRAVCQIDLGHREGLEEASQSDRLFDRSVRPRWTLGASRYNATCPCTESSSCGRNDRSRRSLAAALCLREARHVSCGVCICCDCLEARHRMSQSLPTRHRLETCPSPGISIGLPAGSLAAWSPLRFRSGCVYGRRRKRLHTRECRSALMI